MKIITWMLAIQLLASAGYSKDFPVADFGATGDGKTDDGAAIQKAVNAAIAAGAGSRVVFERKTYRLDWRKDVSYQISLAGAKDIALEGNGALLVSHPRNNLISLTNCSGVSVKGFTVDCDPPPFTQGTITEVNAKDGWIDVRIHKGYRHPVDEYESAGLQPPKKDWGVVFDPVERHRRWDVPMHWYMKEFARSPSGEGIARVFFVDEAKKGLANVRHGDRYVITFKYGNSGANHELSGCGNCRFEDFTVHMAKYGMTFRVEKSSAQNVFRRVKMTFKPGSDRLIVTPKDGFHCKENRVGPLIEECFFEGLLDDSINISACPYWIKKIIAPGVYAMHGAENGAPAVGDRLTAFTPANGEMLDSLVVKSVKPYAKKPAWHEIELDRPIRNPGVNETGNDSPSGPDKMKFTGIYNVDASGANYIVRNCTFREQRRHAMLVRAPGGIIEGNTIDGVGGSGVYMTNEFGSFYEGPVPQNCIIRDNVFRNTQGVPIVVGSKRASSPAAYAKNIRITGNSIEGLATASIQAFSVSGLEISGNKLSLNPAAPADNPPLSLTNIVNETITDTVLTGSASVGSKQPNFILILADDLGYGDLGITGSKQIPTPHIDSLAASGVRFTNAYVSSSVCAPSRAGLMTGKHPASFGFRDNLAPVQPGHDPEFVGLPLNQTTLAQRLKPLGYTTGLVGKWHLGELPKFSPLVRGFDEFWGYLGGAHDYFKAEPGGELQMAGPIFCNYEQPTPLTYLTDDQGGECVDFIRRHKERPFFLFASFAAPHSPMQATEEDLKRFAKIEDKLRRTYCAMVYRLDQNVGKILNEVRAQGIERDTFIVFLSDNGGPSAPGMSNGSLNAPLRGGKTTVLEGGIRVPMIFKWPATLPAGTTMDEMISSLDIFPTFVGAAGGSNDKSEKLTGVDLLPVLTNKQTVAPHESLMWNYTVGSAIRTGDWKLIRLPDRLPMLYNLSADKGEQNDLALEHPDRTRSMLGELGHWEVKSPNPVFREPSDWRIRHLSYYDSDYQLAQPD